MPSLPWAWCHRMAAGEIARSRCRVGLCGKCTVLSVQGMQRSQDGPGLSTGCRLMISGWSIPRLRGLHQVCRGFRIGPKAQRVSNQTVHALPSAPPSCIRLPGMKCEAGAAIRLGRAIEQRIHARADLRPRAPCGVCLPSHKAGANWRPILAGYPAEHPRARGGVSHPISRETVARRDGPGCLSTRAPKGKSLTCRFFCATASHVNLAAHALW